MNWVCEVLELLTNRFNDRGWSFLERRGRGDLIPDSADATGPLGPMFSIRALSTYLMISRIQISSMQ